MRQRLHIAESKKALVQQVLHVYMILTLLDNQNIAFGPDDLCYKKNCLRIQYF